jgi:hypothetical protein
MVRRLTRRVGEDRLKHIQLDAQDITQAGEQAKYTDQKHDMAGDVYNWVFSDQAREALPGFAKDSGFEVGLVSESLRHVEEDPGNALKSLVRTSTGFEPEIDQCAPHGLGVSLEQGGGEFHGALSKGGGELLG